MLTPGRDFLFFDKVDCTQQSFITTMTRGALVITPNQLSMLPEQSTGSVLVATILTKYGVGGENPTQVAKELVAQPAMDVAKLEDALRALLSGTSSRWVFPLAELETFKVTTGFFGMISLKMRGESVRRLVIRDKGGKAAAKAFFAPRAEPVAAHMR
jgi:hypothetical protein